MFLNSGETQRKLKFGYRILFPSLRGLYVGVPTACTEYLTSYVRSAKWRQVTAYSLLLLLTSFYLAAITVQYTQVAISTCTQLLRVRLSQIHWVYYFTNHRVTSRIPKSEQWNCLHCTVQGIWVSIRQLVSDHKWAGAQKQINNLDISNKSLLFRFQESGCHPLTLQPIPSSMLYSCPVTGNAS